MLCPIDQTVLVMTERKGVEIDYCPTCRGVWLDRGELDKIIDASDATPLTPPPPTSYPVDYGSAPQTGYHEPRYADDDRYRDDRRRDDRHERGYDERRDGYDPRYRKRKKKESWLEDLFDF